MKTDLTFEQWLNRFFDRTDFCRDIVENKTARAILSKAFEGGFSIEVAAETLRNAVWSEIL